MKIIIIAITLLFTQSVFSNYQVIGSTDKCVSWDYENDDYCYSDKIYLTIEEACASYDSSHPFGNDYPDYPSGFVPAGDDGCVPTNEGFPDEYLFVPVRKPNVYPIVCFPSQIELKDIFGRVVGCKYAELICSPYEIPIYAADGLLKQCKLEHVCLPTQESFYDSNKEIVACEDIQVVDNDEKDQNQLKDTTSFFDDILNKFNDLSNIFADAFDKIKSIFTHNNDENNPKLENIPIQATHRVLPDFLYSLFPTSVNCPVDNNLNLLGKDYSFSYEKLCNALGLLSNLVMIISIYIGYRIIRSV